MSFTKEQIEILYVGLDCVHVEEEYNDFIKRYDNDLKNALSSEDYEFIKEEIIYDLSTCMEILKKSSIYTKISNHKLIKYINATLVLSEFEKILADNDEEYVFMN